MLHFLKVVLLKKKMNANVKRETILANNTRIRKRMDNDFFKTHEKVLSFFH
jgi:hypothetical protein